jgi:hypothetical protein
VVARDNINLSPHAALVPCVRRIEEEGKKKKQKRGREGGGNACNQQPTLHADDDATQRHDRCFHDGAWSCFL